MKKIKYIGILMTAIIMFTGCGSTTTTTEEDVTSEDTSVTSDVSDNSVDQSDVTYEVITPDPLIELYTPTQIYKLMATEYDKQKYICMLCAETDDASNVLSSTEMYADLDKDFYTCYTTMSGTEFGQTDQNDDGSYNVYAQKIDLKNGKSYYYTDYGWVIDEENASDNIKTILTTFFDFVKEDSIAKVSDYDIPEQLNLDPNGYVILESAYQSQDDSEVYYVSVFVRKDNYLPKYVSLQTYDKGLGDKMIDETDSNISYSDVLLQGRLYEFEFFNDGSEGSFSEANAEVDEYITMDEYGAAYYSDTGYEETDITLDEEISEGPIIEEIEEVEEITDEENN